MWILEHYCTSALLLVYKYSRFHVRMLLMKAKKLTESILLDEKNTQDLTKLAIF